MNTLDQVKLLEQKVLSAVEKIQQLQAENDALRSKCAELTNALSCKSEQLQTFENDKHLIESGIQNALEHLNSIENSVLDKDVQVSPFLTNPEQTNPTESDNKAPQSEQTETTIQASVNDTKVSDAFDNIPESSQVQDEITEEEPSVFEPQIQEQTKTEESSNPIFGYNFFGGGFPPSSENKSESDRKTSATFETMEPLNNKTNTSAEPEADSAEETGLESSPFGNNFGYAIEDDNDDESGENKIDIW